MSTETETLQSTEPAGEAFALPASFAQQRLWFLDQLEPGSATYNVPLVTRLRGPLDVAALEAALYGLVERHESLRTGFFLEEGTPQQLISPPRPLTLVHTDLRGRADAEARARMLVDEEARRPFDLAGDRLVRVALIRLADEDHIFILTVHHIVSDAWSVGVIKRELTALYNAKLEGRVAELPELTIQPGDYAVWQQEWMETGGLDEQVEYWRQQLAGAPALLELPTDKPRPAVQSFRGATVRRTLPAPLAESLRALGEEQGVTMFMTLLTAFMTMLARYTGRSDILVASPVANRSRVELEGIVGLFVNTLVLRSSIDGNASFSDNLAQVREASLGAFSHQDLPFEKLVQELNPKRDRSHAPLAQVFFHAQSAAESSGGFAGLEQEPIAAERGTSKFDLALLVRDGPTGLVISLEYCTDLFEAATIARMLGHLQTLLEGIVEDPSRPVAALPMLEAAEQHDAASGSAPVHEGYPVTCMHERFERHAASAPDAVALSFEGATVSYGDLNARANRLAHRLRELGAGPETLVALFLEPSIETIVAILGVQKAGAAYVPLDPAYPTDRIAFVLQDTRASLIVSREDLLSRLPATGATDVCLDRDAAALASLDAADPEPLATPESLAYVIYTSGSTGQPKGVLVEHRNVARLFTATDEWYGFGPSDVWTLLHSYAFDFSVWELWGALAYGGRLVISPPATTRSPAELAGLIAEQGVTVLNATPSLFVTVQEDLLSVADQLALRFVIFGGEALSPPTLRPWYERFGEAGATLVNMYGITETTVHVTYRPLTAADCALGTSPIGVPIPDLSLHLLDPNASPVPVGVVGELFVGGAGVARGYLNRPELSAQRFIENPFGPGRLYRTGDVARRLPDGELDYRGRIDDQVKIRGYRIELGEIESVLASHSAVRSAVAMVREDVPGDQRLVAYVTPADGPVPDQASLRQFVESKLPPYMVPSTVTTLEAFPLTPNGKVDRKRLPAPDGAQPVSAYAPPETELEQDLARIWCRLLRLDKVGIDDDFFELGGHSLLAVQLVRAVEQELDRICALPILFRTGTIRSLAAELVAGGVDCTTPTALQLRTGRTGPPIFCICGVHIYQAFADALGTDSSVYGIFLPEEQQMFEVGDGASSLVVEEIARGYVDVVREQQPHGPYVFIGLSFGGLIIYEMARQLERAGEKVSLLVFLDSIAPGTVQLGWKRTIRRQLRKARERGRKMAVAVRLRPAPPEGQMELIRLDRMRMQIYVAARRRYEMKSSHWPGRAVLVRTDSTAAFLRDGLVDPACGWTNYIGELEIEDSPGDHVSLLQRPHVQVLASKLRPHIEHARADAQGS